MNGAEIAQLWTKQRAIDGNDEVEKKLEAARPPNKEPADLAKWIRTLGSAAHPINLSPCHVHTGLNWRQLKSFLPSGSAKTRLFAQIFHFSQ